MRICPTASFCDGRDLTTDDDGVELNVLGCRLSGDVDCRLSSDVD